MAVNTTQLISRFRQLFPEAQPRLLVRSPGRVNLIGEHVDYNDGFVLPIAMTQATYVLAAPTDDGIIAAYSTAFDETIRYPAADPGPPGKPAWGNYVRGVTEMLRRQGIGVPGCRLLIDSDVPVGGGVSSSAALEVGTALALLTLAGRNMERVPLALLARQAEHEYAGSPCGIMDQFICALGRKDHALLLDCRTQVYEHLPLVFDELALMVMNTQVKHELGSSEYPVRQRQCQAGLKTLQAANAKIVALRDASMADLDAVAGSMDQIAFRRCRHVITEIERTVQASDVLRGGDLTAFGRLMTASHESLRDDYAVSCEELDALVEIANRVPGTLGARMTGGGFGGCAIALIHRSAEPQLREAIKAGYDPKYAKPALVYPTAAADGAAVSSV